MKMGDAHSAMEAQESSTLVVELVSWVGMEKWEVRALAIPIWARMPTRTTVLLMMWRDNVPDLFRSAARIDILEASFSLTRRMTELTTSSRGSKQVKSTCRGTTRICLSGPASLSPAMLRSW